jgi:hypothetical protein
MRCNQDQRLHDPIKSTVIVTSTTITTQTSHTINIIKQCYCYPKKKTLDHVEPTLNEIDHIKPQKAAFPNQNRMTYLKYPDK